MERQILSRQGWWSIPSSCYIRIYEVEFSEMYHTSLRTRFFGLHMSGHAKIKETTNLQNNSTIQKPIHLRPTNLPHIPKISFKTLTLTPIQFTSDDVVHGHDGAFETALLSGWVVAGEVVEYFEVY